MFNQRNKEVTNYAKELTRIMKRKTKLQVLLEEASKKEKELIFKLSSLYSNLPIDEKAEQIKTQLVRYKKMTGRRKSDNAKNRWANMSEEQKQRRLQILADARNKRMELIKLRKQA